MQNKLIHQHLFLNSKIVNPTGFFYSKTLMLHLLQLQEVPGLAQRMAVLMCVDGYLTVDEEAEGRTSIEDTGSMCIEDILEHELCRAKENKDTVRWLELDELDIDDDTLLSLDLSAKFPVGVNYLHPELNYTSVVGTFENY